MHQATWIWYYGEHALFHALLLHTRRMENGLHPLMEWSLAPIYPCVHFHKTFTSSRDTTFTVKVNGTGEVVLDDIQYAPDTEIPCVPGKHTLLIRVIHPKGLPAVYVDGEEIYSDETWTASYDASPALPVGNRPVYSSPNDNVEVFPFSYRLLQPVDGRRTEEGWLFDFGKETFAALTLLGDGAYDVYFGESEEEALATDRSIELAHRTIIYAHLQLHQKATLPAYAFRYVYVVGRAPLRGLFADYEYLPSSPVGAFHADDPLIDRIYDTCAYTLELNTRETFLDGIKRDRWIWSGDAYQSAMIAAPYVNDSDTAERTFLSLLGKPPYHNHVNTINDYTFYLIIGIYEQYFRTGHVAFVKNIFDRLTALYDFAVSRLNADGLVDEKPGDWIFIDWSDTLDKQGPVCAEQILLWQATRCLQKLSDVVGIPVSTVDEKALRQKILSLYYRPALGGFIDSFQSGKEMVNRQANVLAILYGITDRATEQTITEKVLLSDAVPPITTPFFKFFELLALCKMGQAVQVASYIRSYWGGMLALGATSVWEAFDPRQNGVEHYAMYGKDFGKSLCHAWGAGPICLLANYIAGVRITSVGAQTFEVAPLTDVYSSFDATVALGGGTVHVSFRDGDGVRVSTDRSGGVLRLFDKEYPLLPEEEIFIKTGYLMKR